MSQNKNWIYPNIMRDLKKNCEYFLKGNLSVEEIQAYVYIAEQQIVALEERWLRNMLFNAENKIEEYRFTVDEEKIRERVIPIITDILKEIS